MAYQKLNWLNKGETGAKPINKDNLNHMDNGIETNDKNTGELSNLNTTNKDSIVNSINEVNNKFDYSTEEQVIGKWTNGKPLYRKTITFTSTISANATTSIAHNIENAKNIFIDLNASFMEANVGSSNYISYNLPLIGYDGNITDKVYCYVNYTNINFYSNGSWARNWTKHITLNYTKTTD